MADEVNNINKINNIDKNNYINKINVRNLALDVVVDVMDKGDYSDKAIHMVILKKETELFLQDFVREL